MIMILMIHTGYVNTAYSLLYHLELCIGFYDDGLQLEIIPTQHLAFPTG